MSELVPNDYSVPVYRSLTQPILIGGLPKMLTVFLLGAGALLFGAMLMWPPFVYYFIGAEGAVIAAYWTSFNRYKTDPHYYAVLLQNRGPWLRRGRGPVRFVP